MVACGNRLSPTDAAAETGDRMGFGQLFNKIILIFAKLK